LKTALITGASGGYGREFSRLFSRDGWDLVVVARGAPALEAMADEIRRETSRRVLVVTADLARDGAADDVFERVRAAGVEVGALVNNAGFATYGAFAQTALGPEVDELHVNVVTLTHLTKRLLPPMIAAKDGYVLNVASSAAFAPGPYQAVYYASKAYVLHFSEALSIELQGTGVSATAFCPGATATGFQSRAGIPKTRLFRRGGADVAVLARTGYRAMLARKALVVPGFSNMLLAFGARLAPRAVNARIVAYLNST
jgi:uncharacterized protein